MAARCDWTGDGPKVRYYLWECPCGAIGHWDVETVITDPAYLGVGDSASESEPGFVPPDHRTDTSAHEPVSRTGRWWTFGRA
jgi:hypothetical protein